MSKYGENYAKIDWSRPLPEVRRDYVAPARSRLPAPQIITDTTEPLRSMADGKMYTSKAAMRATYKPGGNPEGKRYVEVGNEKQDMTTDRYRPDRKGIRKAVEQSFAEAGIS